MLARSRSLAARAATLVPPGAGAVVMGSGIVSDALQSEGHRALSVLALVVAGIAWVVLAAVVADRFDTDPRRVAAESSSAASLTGVAGTAVLGARLTVAGADWAGVVALALALVGWGYLQPRVVSARPRVTTGASFLLAVSTQGLAVLLAVVAFARGWGWATWPAVVLLAAGLAQYVVVLLRFDMREIGRAAGDQWVAGGALAIAALACAYVAQLSAATGHAAALHLGDASVVLWVVAALWAPVLVAGELVRPRLRYATARWATVFPLGMYAESALVAGRAGAAPALVDIGRVWTWVALAAWIAVLAAMLPVLARGWAWARAGGRAQRD